MPAVGVRPPKSSVPVDVVGPLSGPAPHTRVDVVGQQRLGRPTLVDVAHYPGPPSASVDVIRQPYSSFMGADVVRPTPIHADVVHPSSMDMNIDLVKSTCHTGISHYVDNLLMHNFFTYYSYANSNN